MLVHHVVETPVGPLRLVADDDALEGAWFEAQRVPRAHAAAPPAGADHRVLARAARELEEYFAGARTELGVALAPEGTEFQRRVWTALGAIPFGERQSYSALAASLGTPGGARAAGAAAARNPLSIFVPCHRLVGRDGALRGYAGGLGIKRWLLAHERAGAGKRGP